jgi:hypothetical protein
MDIVEEQSRECSVEEDNSRRGEECGYVETRQAGRQPELPSVAGVTKTVWPAT